jgi:hypothetical protein
MHGPKLFAAYLLILAALTGCKSVARPDWTHPGTEAAQRKRALRYDPYPEVNAGEPSMAGVRPREYDAPPPECSRARWEVGKWGQ